jgi:hypothetical protein
MPGIIAYSLRPCRVRCASRVCETTRHKCGLPQIRSLRFNDAAVEIGRARQGRFMRRHFQGQGLLESLIVVALSAVAAFGVVYALAQLAEWSPRLAAFAEEAEPIADRRGSIEAPPGSANPERKPESLRGNQVTGAPDG